MAILIHTKSNTLSQRIEKGTNAHSLAGSRNDLPRRADVQTIVFRFSDMFLRRTCGPL
ncbi:hypothetical protein V3C99_010839, partial [Haemonchus contortus]